MPLPFFFAIVLAFGLNLPTQARPLGRGELMFRLAETSGGVLLVGVIAFILGELAASRVDRPEGVFSSRRLFVWGSRFVVALGLLVFAWTLVVVDWRRVVDWGLGLRGVVIVEESAVLLPYLAAQLLAWCGLYRAERVLRPRVAPRGLAWFLVRKARRLLGMVLPVALIYVVGRNLLRWGFPEGWDDASVQLAGRLAIGVVIFLVSPLFVRLTLPTRKLAAGPLRDRLEHLARRLKFRCTDILVWDTDGYVINAGVVGVLPWFRYVMITDAMIDRMDEHEIEAAFGHEVGHVAHHHLPYFGLFFLGSAGLITLFDTVVDRFLPIESILNAIHVAPSAAGMVQECINLVFLVLYFLVVFGILSRSFERQADVFGTRSVSCGSIDCPPHPDLNNPTSPVQPMSALCPVGIRIFANTLSSVAVLNGMSREARSWRHGSVARRIQFLLTLEGGPEVERRFQKGVIRLRWALAMVLALASAAALCLSRGGSR